MVRGPLKKTHLDRAARGAASAKWQILKEISSRLGRDAEVAQGQDTGQEAITSPICSALLARSSPAVALAMAPVSAGSGEEGDPSTEERRPPEKRLGEEERSQAFLFLHQVEVFLLLLEEEVSFPAL